MSNYAEVPQHIKDLADARAEIERLRDEIEELRERMREAAKLNMGLMDIRRDNEAEIERLREVESNTTAAMVEWERRWRSTALENERLRERINNALDALNDDDISGATLILYEGVREALGGEMSNILDSLPPRDPITSMKNAEIKDLESKVARFEDAYNQCRVTLKNVADDRNALWAEFEKLKDKFDELNGANILNANALKLALEKVGRLQKLLRSGLHKHTHYPGGYRALQSEPGLFAYWESVKEELGEEEDD